jgi:hypothetical protein
MHLSLHQGMTSIVQTGDLTGQRSPSLSPSNTGPGQGVDRGTSGAAALATLLGLSDSCTTNVLAQTGRIAGSIHDSCTTNVLAQTGRIAGSIHQSCTTNVLAQTGRIAGSIHDSCTTNVLAQTGRLAGLRAGRPRSVERGAYHTKSDARCTHHASLPDPLERHVECRSALHAVQECKNQCQLPADDERANEQSSENENVGGVNKCELRNAHDQAGQVQTPEVLAQTLHRRCCE